MTPNNTPTTTPTTPPKTTFSSLPLDVIEKIVAQHLESLPDVSSARLASAGLASAGYRHLHRLGLAAHLARRALRAHRTTLLLRRGLVGQVVSTDELTALAEEEAEDEAEEVALLLVVGAPPTASDANREARRLKRQHRRAEAEALRAASQASLAAAVALAATASGGAGGGGGASTPLPLPPLPPPFGSSRRELGLRISSLISLSPDPVVDLLAAAHNAMLKAGETPPLPLPNALDVKTALYLAAKREQVKSEMEVELSAVIATVSARLWEQEQGQEEQGGEQLQGGGGGGGGAPMEEDGDGVVLLPQNAPSESGDSTPMMMDASIQTTGGNFGPSLEVLQVLKRDVLELAASTTSESLFLLEACFLIEIRAWEGLPMPLP